MKNRYFILFLVIVVFFLVFFIFDRITGNVVVEDQVEYNCVYGNKFGVNELFIEDCCRRIKGFYECEEFDEEINIFYDGSFKGFNRQCYNNINGELSVFVNEDAWEFCEDEGYI